MAKNLKKTLNPKLLFIAILLFASFLRIWKIDQVPVSLFGDELDVGYHAFSILKTGKDYSGNPWPMHFQSLAEWRTPLYLYSAVPTVAFFGISPLGVRLPAVLFGIISIWGMYLLVGEISKKKSIALLAAFLLTISPWHLQYSRAAFEVTQFLSFLIFGIYFFLKSLKNGKYLWVSAACFAATPWIYSTAKFFTPFLIIFLTLLYRKELLKIPRKYLLYGFIALLVVGGPIAYSTVFGGGTARFNYISVFSDPTIEPEIGTARMHDGLKRGNIVIGYQPTALDKIFHNKFTFWGEKIERNLIQSLSFDFWFGEGDPNLRHSIKNVGQFYKIEAIGLILGMIMFFAYFKDTKSKYLIAFWILVGVVPAAITRDGGNHATRLILVLPPLIFLISYGVANFGLILPKLFKLPLITMYCLALLIGFVFYQHEYWVHNPWDSERWWHSGWKEAIQAIKNNESNYKTVVISTADEPPWIFFAGWYQFDPVKWHQGYPFKKTILPKFGEVSYIDKYYFGSPNNNAGLYEWGKVFDADTLYLATAKEVRVNLIMEPERLPGDLKLLQAISFPSGEPAFYLLAKPK